MNLEQAREIIDHLERKHRQFKLLGFQVHDRGMFMTFEQMDIDPRTIANWIERAGGTPLYVGSEGTGDRRVMSAEVRL